MARTILVRLALTIVGWLIVDAVLRAIGAPEWLRAVVLAMAVLIALGSILHLVEVLRRPRHDLTGAAAAVRLSDETQDRMARLKATPDVRDRLKVAAAQMYVAARAMSGADYAGHERWLASMTALLWTADDAGAPNVAAKARDLLERWTELGPEERGRAIDEVVGAAARFADERRSN